MSQSESLELNTPFSSYFPGTQIPEDKGKVYEPLIEVSRNIVKTPQIPSKLHSVRSASENEIDYTDLDSLLFNQYRILKKSN